jgi:hypothetical protein
VPRVDWRFVVLLLTLAAAWWTFTLLRGCERTRLPEWPPAEQRDGGK